MADLLSTLLVTGALVTLLGWRVDWIAPRWVAVAMGGAIVPDLGRISMLVEARTVEGLLGLPFAYHALETVGGVLLAAGVITVAFERSLWARVYGCLVAGGVVHLLLDGLRVYADGRASTWLLPVLPAYRPPTPNLFVSSDPAVLVATLAFAVLVFTADRRLVDDGIWR